MHGAYSVAEVARRVILLEEDGLGHPFPDLSGRCAEYEIDDSIVPSEARRVHNIDLIRNKATETHEIRITRYSEVHGYFQRNIEDVPI